MFQNIGRLVPDAVSFRLTLWVIDLVPLLLSAFASSFWTLGPSRGRTAWTSFHGARHALPPAQRGGASTFEERLGDDFF